MRAPIVRLPSTRLPVGRMALAVLALGVVILAASLAVLLGGGSPPAPIATGAARIIPGDALLYVNLSVDSGRPAVVRAGQIAGLPQYRSLFGVLETRMATLLSGGRLTAPRLADAVRPWFGREAALAWLNTAGQAVSQVLVLDVAERSSAQAFLRRFGARSSGIYGGLRLYRYPSGTELVFVRHFLVAGADPAVRGVIDTAQRRLTPLAADPGFRRADAGEPADRLLDAYASAAGVTRLLDSRAGLLGAAGQLLSAPDLIGASLSVSLPPDGLRAQIHVAYDPALAALHGHVKPIASALMDAVPPGSPLALEVANLRQATPTILATAARLGVAAQVAPLLNRLGTALGAEGIDVSGLLDQFTGDSVLAVGPGPDHPIIIITRTSDTLGARARLAELESPLAQLFAAPGGQPPQWTGYSVAGVPVRALVVANGLELDYAVSGGLVILATRPDGVVQVIDRKSSLSAQPGYVMALGMHPPRMTSLLFLDLSQLLRLGGRSGLTRGAPLGELQPALERARAAGLRTTRLQDDTNVELFLQIP